MLGNRCRSRGSPEQNQACQAVDNYVDAYLKGSLNGLSPFGFRERLSQLVKEETESAELTPDEAYEKLLQRHSLNCVSYSDDQECPQIQGGSKKDSLSAVRALSHALVEQDCGNDLFLVYMEEMPNEECERVIRPRIEVSTDPTYYLYPVGLSRIIEEKKFSVKTLSPEELADLIDRAVATMSAKDLAEFNLVFEEFGEGQFDQPEDIERHLDTLREYHELMYLLATSATESLET